MSDIEPEWYFENPLLKSLEQIFQDKAPEWKRGAAWYSDEGALSSEWIDGESKVIIHIARMASTEEAASHLELFAWHIPLTASDFEEVMRDPDHYQLPQPVMPDAKLPNLGNGNYVWTRYDERGSSLIKLQAGNLFVQVDGSSFAIAERFARLVAEQISSA
jgi:hypothetical protein